MNVREKLVELLDEVQEYGFKNRFVEWLGINMKDSVANIRIADHLIANGVTVQEWISVKDRLPEREQEVIVYAGNVLKPCVYCYHFWEADMDSWARVTHWMPLPQPPKGE